MDTCHPKGHPGRREHRCRFRVCPVSRPSTCSIPFDISPPSLRHSCSSRAYQYADSIDEEEQEGEEGNVAERGVDSTTPAVMPVTLIGSAANEVRRSFLCVSSRRDLFEISWKSSESLDEANGDMITPILPPNSVPKTVATQRWNGEFDERESLILRMSFDGRYCAIASPKALSGIVVDLDARAVVYRFTRRTHYPQHCRFPFVFIKQTTNDNQCLFIYSVAWNKLVVIDVVSGQLVVPETSKHFEFFFGELKLSPDSKYIASSGWVWHPIGLMFSMPVDGLFRVTDDEGYKENGAKTFYDSYDWGYRCEFVTNTKLAIAGFQPPDCCDVPVNDSIALVDVQAGTLLSRMFFCPGFPSATPSMFCDTTYGRIYSHQPEFQCWSIDGLRERIAGFGMGKKNQQPSAVVVAQGGLNGSVLLFRKEKGGEENDIGDSLCVGWLAESMFLRVDKSEVLLNAVLSGDIPPFSDVEVECVD